MRYIGYLCTIFTLIGCTSSPQTLRPPAGLRPCCAFGQDLKAELFHIPIPFFSINNLLDAQHLGEHSYNDGSQFAITKLLGLSKEKDGLLYTQRGGFIDIAHVRDTADYTFYLYQQIFTHLGQGKWIVLPDELRSRRIYLPRHTTPISPEMRKEMSIALAGLMAFHLAQWHEIAQWYGFQSEWGIPETVSAFSPEDLYSNMLGAKIAQQILTDRTPQNADQFSQYVTNALNLALHHLDATPKEMASQKMMALNGNWWDNQKRLPQKWLVRKRDYRVSLTTYPNGIRNGKLQQFSPILPNGQYYTNWANLVLVKTKDAPVITTFPANLANKKYILITDFPTLARFAYDKDAQILGHSPQVE